MLNSYENLKAYCPSFVASVESGETKLVQLVEFPTFFAIASIDPKLNEYYIGTTTKADLENGCIDDYTSYQYKQTWSFSTKIPDSVLTDINNQFLVLLDNIQ